MAAFVAKLIALQDRRGCVTDVAVHPYARHVNPYLAQKLKQLKIDRSFVRGEGCYVYNSDGERYLDFMAQYGALPFGHHP